MESVETAHKNGEKNEGPKLIKHLKDTYNVFGLF